MYTAYGRNKRVFTSAFLAFSPNLDNKSLTTEIEQLGSVTRQHHSPDFLAVLMNLTQRQWVSLYIWCTEQFDADSKHDSKENDDNSLGVIVANQHVKDFVHQS